MAKSRKSNGGRDPYEEVRGDEDPESGTPKGVSRQGPEGDPYGDDSDPSSVTSRPRNRLPLARIVAGIAGLGIILLFASKCGAAVADGTKRVFAGQTNADRLRDSRTMGTRECGPNSQVVDIDKDNLYVANSSQVSPPERGISTALGTVSAVGDIGAMASIHQKWGRSGTLRDICQVMVRSGEQNPSDARIVNVPASTCTAAVIFDPRELARDSDVPLGTVKVIGGSVTFVHGQNGDLRTRADIIKDPSGLTSTAMSPIIPTPVDTPGKFGSNGTIDGSFRIETATLRVQVGGQLPQNVTFSGADPFIMKKLHPGRSGQEWVFTDSVKLTDPWGRSVEKGCKPPTPTTIQSLN